MRYVVIAKYCDELESLLGVYGSCKKAYGAVMLDCLENLDRIKENIKRTETVEMTIDSHEDDANYAFMDVIARYSETSFNSAYEHFYRIFFERDDENGNR